MKIQRIETAGVDHERDWLPGIRLRVTETGEILELFRKKLRHQDELGNSHWTLWVKRG